MFYKLLNIWEIFNLLEGALKQQAKNTDAVHYFDDYFGSR